MLHWSGFKHYIPRLVHGLLKDDEHRRLKFCEFFLNEYKYSLDIVMKIIWWDEANFKLYGNANRHNFVYWHITNLILPLQPP